MKTILRASNYIWKYPVLSVSYLLCAIISLSMLPVFPKITKHIIDIVIPAKDLDKLIWLSLLALVGFCIMHLFNSLRIILNNIFEQNIIFDIRSDLYSKIQSLPITWFDDQHTGDVMTRVAEDVTNMERVLVDGVEYGITAVLQITLISFFLFLSNWQLALITLAPIPLMLLGAYLYISSAYLRHKEVRKATSRMNSILHDNISGIQQIKAFALEEQEHKRFNKSSQAVRKATLKVMRYWAVYSPSMAFLNSLGYILVISFGGTMAIKGTLSFGELTEFLVYLAFFYEPITRLHGLNQMWQAGRAAANRVFEIIDTESEPDWHKSQNKSITTDKVFIKSIKGNVTYKNVNFAFTKKQNTLDKISFDIKAGESVALVGHTGAGKSTIVNLLPRFYEIGSGQILIDGKDIKEFSKTDLRNIISYVTQESFLFNGTVKENLLIARPEAAEEEIWQALKAANAENFVKKLPDKLETNVGERGIKLSVGEKQRVSIARALLRNAPILILDEATASVDNQTERKIQQALDRLIKSRTSIVIAHRLSTIKNADCIYVLEHGRIVEQGNHKKLIRQNGIYAKLIRMGTTESDFIRE